MDSLKNDTKELARLKRHTLLLSRFSKQIIISLSADFLITEFNAIAERIYNCRSKTILGKNYFKVFTKQHLKHFSPVTLKRLKPNKPVRNYKTFLKYHGNKHELVWTLICVGSNAKAKLYSREYLLIGEDNSGHDKYEKLQPKQIKQKHSLAKELYLEALITNLPGNVYWKNRKGVYLGCNDNVIKSLGFASREAYVGKKIEQLFDKSVADKVNAVDEKVMRENKVVIVEEYGPCLNGEWGTYLTHKVPLQDKKGKVVGLLGVSFDITDRKKLESELEKAKADAELQAKRANIYLENIIANLPGQVYWKDKDHVYLGCNENNAKLMGFSSPREFIGKTPEQFLSKDLAEILRKNDDQIMSSGVGYTIEENGLTLDGTPAVYLTSKVPLRDNNGNVIGLVGISFNISDRKKMEQALNEAKDRAEAANQAKSEFLAMVSHELRIPLTGILGMAQLMRGDDLNTLQSQQINDILTAGKHLLALVNDLLDIAKLEANKLELNIALVDLRKLIEEISTMLIFQCTAKGLELIVDYSSDVPHQIMGDARALRQIILNLLGNAVKFTDQGYVLIRVECLEKTAQSISLQIVVEDTGVGIPKDKIATIFERFTQVDASHTRRFAGAGLGLAITKAYVDLMNGSIKVESTLSKGTKFLCTINFPLPDIKLITTVWERYKSEVRILVVEDTLRGKVIVKHLGSSLCQQTSSDSVLNTLLVAQQNHQAFDIVIIDQAIRHGDAMQLAETITKQQSLQQPLLILLGSVATLTAKNLARAAGYQEVLLKPVQPTELLITLTAAWERWVDKRKQTTVEKFHIATKSKAKSKSSQPYVLLVEDDPIIQRVHSMMLQRIGCEVDIVDSGPKALKMLENDYDVVFMDVGMVGMDGMEVAEAIRKLPTSKRDIPIIGITGYGHEEYKQKCFKAGMNDVLVKPVEQQQIQQLIQHWVTRKM